MKSTTYSSALFAFVFVCSSFAYAESASVEKLYPCPAPTDRKVIGIVEEVTISPENLVFDAKLAPGFERSSLHAKNIKRFKRKGDSWVRFSVTDNKGKAITLERKLVEKVESGSAENKKKTPVVTLNACVAGITLELEVMLENRSSYAEELRIGREPLAGNFLIDPAVTHSCKPVCEAKKK